MADPRAIIAEAEQLVQQRKAAGRDYVRLGDAYIDLGDLSKARDAYQKAIGKDAFVLGHNGIGRVYAQTPGRGLKAQYYFRRVLGKDPTFVDALYHLAKLYVRMRPLEAEEAFEKSVEMAPDHQDAHFQIGQLHEDSRDRAGALLA